MGNALSPNGIGFSGEGMVSLALCDKILGFDESTGRISVQAGARLSAVLDALRARGFTLQNLASIKEQQADIRPRRPPCPLGCCGRPSPSVERCYLQRNGRRLGALPF